MSAFGKVSWTIVFNEKGKDRRLKLDKTDSSVSTFIPRLDDTLSVVHYKLQQLTKSDIYWWVDTDRKHLTEWPESKKYICPYVHGAYSMKEPFSHNASPAENSLDLLGSFTRGPNIYVCELPDLYAINNNAEHVVPVSLSDNVNAHVIESTETSIVAAEANVNPMKQIAVSGFALETVYGNYNKGIDSSLLEKYDMASGEVLMMGVQTGDGIAAIRIPEEVIESKNLSVTTAMTEANDLIRSPPKGEANALYVTSIDKHICSTQALENVQITTLHDTFSTVQDAEETVDATQSFVSRLRKLRLDKSIRDHSQLKWMQLNCIFDSLILTKDSLIQALDSVSPFIYWEDTDNSNVIVHYKRVPFFKAQEGRAQFVERHAHMLTDGTTDELVTLMTDQYGIDRDEALHEIEVHNVVSGAVSDDYDQSNKYMKMITEVGAMATVGVSARGMKVSLRCVGSLDYSYRLLSILSLLAQTEPSDIATIVPNGAESLEAQDIGEVTDLQAALAAVKEMDAKIAVMAVDEPIKANMYILDRLYDHDPKIFKYGKSRFKTYAKQCGAVNMRQPIAVSPEKMALMKSNGTNVPDSIRAGEGGNYYMCPEYWCPVGEVPMTAKEVKDSGGLCVSGEKPLDLSSAAFWSQGAKRSPGLLAPEKHPLGLYAPCCFKNMKNMMVARIQKCQEVGQCPKGDIQKSVQTIVNQEDENMRYIMSNTSYPLPLGRKGYLPDTLDGNEFKGIFRVGISQEDGAFVNSVAMALGIDPFDVVNSLVSNLTIMKVASIARGNLIRRFIDQSIQIHDPQHAKNFDTYMSSVAGLAYKKSMYNRTSKTDRLRDFALWNGYMNIIEYIRRGNATDHTFILPLLILGLDLSIHVLEAKDNTFSLHCPYGYTSQHKKQSVVILKQDDVYEPLVGETDVLKMILDGQYRQMCQRIVGPNTHEVVLNHLINDEKLDVEAQVINLSFETVGVVAEGLFIPFKTTGQLDLDLPMMYVDQLSHDAVKPWNVKSSLSLFGKLSKATGGKWYTDVEAVEKSDMSFIVVDGAYVPIHNAGRVLTLAKQDLTIFVTSMTDDDEEAETVGLAHDAVMAYLIKHHSKELFVFTHPMCPFSNKDVMAKMMDMTSSLSDIGDDIRARVVHTLVTRQHRQTGMIHRSNEIFATEQDVVDGTFLYVLKNIERGFDTVESSRSLFSYAPETTETNMITVPTPRQWRGMLSGLILHTLPTASYIFLRRLVHAINGDKLTKKRYLAIVGKALKKDLDTGTVSHIMSSSRMESLKKVSRVVDTPKAEILKHSDIPPNGHIASVVMSLHAVNFIVVSVSGDIIGQGRSTKHNHIIIFELEDGRLAVAQKDDKIVLHQDDIPPITMDRYFPKLGRSLRRRGQR